MAAQDPLTRNYYIRMGVNQILGQGSDGVVGYGVARSGQEAGETHALKFLSRKACSSDSVPQEVAIMQKFDHVNIMSVLGHYAPMP